ncbi:hypothetical protein M378DRAFT_6057 [Amanita muscaria Koide BX008]|uniref:DUF6534 domain-containing protein n=1 Tax=Amanita muscaria (strain Koide BX008) TaxID=946122 RepID=A0A0C2XNR5_AMAMK|nr:hypothetical protein M378DRAFT_6057 [Amanita muscaria Koide BX008]
MQPLDSGSVRTEVVLGSILAGNLINLLLHGVLTVQLYLYYLAFQNDSTWTKAAVYTVYILETIQAVGLGIIQILIIVGGNPLPARFGLGVYWTSHEYIWAIQALLITVIGGLVPFIAQCIYAHRIRIITQGKAVPNLIISLSTLQLFAAILTVTMSAQISDMIVLVLWSVFNVVNDLIIAFVMVRSLSKEKLLSNYTRSKVIRLVRLIIATGSLTVAVNILALVSLAIDASIFGWIGTAAVIFMPKVYANSILVMLNNRMTVRNSREVTPLALISINALNTLVTTDHQIDSENSRDESFSTSGVAGLESAKSYGTS